MAHKLESHTQKLNAKISQLQASIEKQHQQAKQWMQKASVSKGSAKQMFMQKCKMALNKKKAYQKQLKTYSGQTMMVQQMKMNHQNFKDQAQMMETLQQANYQQKKAMQKIDIDKFQELQDQMRQMKLESDYVNDMLNRNYDVDVDSDQLDDELMEFEAQIKREKKKQNSGKNVNINKNQGNQMHNYPNLN